MAISEPPQSSSLQIVSTITTSTLQIVRRDRTVIWLALLFMSMVLLSAYLGWSANHAIERIYAKAVLLFQAEGRLVPTNPVSDTSPLSMLRNMTTYVSLLGALVAIVLGTQMIAEDRRSGIYPLIASRPVAPGLYALGKVMALFLAIGGLLLLAALVNALTLATLPGAAPSPADWIALIQFYLVSALFLTAFGLMALATAALCRSETMGLVMPVSAWLALTFVFPQLSANINPMAALNPIKAMVAPPSGVFFKTMGPILAPISLTSTYRDIAATLLGFAPANAASMSIGSGIGSLLGANILLGLLAVVALTRLDATRSESDE